MLLYHRQSMKPPPGGHRYQFGSISFAGETFEAVVEKVRDFRTNNRMPLGNPEQDVLGFYRTIAPWLVLHAPESEVVHDRQKVAESIMATSYGRYEMLVKGDPVIRRRIETCALCPWVRHEFNEGENRYWHEAESRAALMTAEINPSAAGWCAHHHWLISVAARLKVPEKLSLAFPPANCYVPLA